MTTANMASYRRSMGAWAAVFGAAALISGRAPAGDLTTDNLTVNKDGTFYGNLAVRDAGSGSAPTNGLVFYYSFSMNTNPVPNDFGAIADGDVCGATWGTNGVTGGAYTFDGNDDYINVTNASLFQFQSDFSISLWMKTTSDYQNLIGNFDAPNGCGYLISIQSGGRATFRFHNGSYHLPGGALEGATTSLNDGSWHNVIVAVKRGDVMRIYVDSTLDASASDDGSSINYASNLFFVGAGYDSRESPICWWNMNGPIDEIRIYDRALSANEVHGLYLRDLHMTAGTARFETGVNYVLPLGDVGMGIYTNAP